jgi:ketosteroid isomerase-like protein
MVGAGALFFLSGGFALKVRRRMDDYYAINVAKTHFREAYNSGDVEQLIAITHPKFVDFSDARNSAFSDGARNALRAHFTQLFARCNVQLVVIMIEIRLSGDVAYDYGWHEFTFTPKQGGAVEYVRERYVDIWKKDASGQWKLWMYMNNRDVPNTMVAAVELITCQAWRRASYKGVC